MISLSASAINVRSPYKVVQTQQNSFQFTTDCGNAYEVGFVREDMFDFENVYQFFIEDKLHSSKSSDVKIEQTIVAVLEEFFSHQNAILDYICDAGDGKQAARNRLFLHWIKCYANRNIYTYRCLSMEVENITFYATVLLKRDNTMYDLFLKTVDAFEKDLFSKLH